MFASRVISGSLAELILGSVSGYTLTEEKTDKMPSVRVVLFPVWPVGFLLYQSLMLLIGEKC